VPQWPNGALALSLAPLRARPLSLVILVVVAVSSMKTSRCGSSRIRGWRPRRHVLLRSTTSARAASSANSVFFFDGKARRQKQARERRGMRGNATFGFQSQRQLRHADVGLGFEPADQPVPIRRQLATAARTPLTRRGKRPGRRHPPRQSHTRARAHAKPTSRRPARLPNRDLAINPLKINRMRFAHDPSPSGMMNHTPEPKKIPRFSFRARRSREFSKPTIRENYTTSDRCLRCLTVVRKSPYCTGPAIQS